MASLAQQESQYSTASRTERSGSTTVGSWVTRRTEVMDWQQSNWNDSYFYSDLELEGSLIKRYLEGYDFSDRKKERQYLRVLMFYFLRSSSICKAMFREDYHGIIRCGYLKS